VVIYNYTYILSFVNYFLRNILYMHLNYTYIVVKKIFTQDTVFSRRYHVALQSLKNEDKQTFSSDNPNSRYNWDKLSAYIRGSNLGEGGGGLE